MKGGAIRKPKYSNNSNFHGKMDVDNVSQGFSSWYDLNRAVIEDNSNDGMEYYKVQADNSPDKPDDTFLVYRMKTQSNYRLVPSESFLDLQFHLESTGVALVADDLVVHDGDSCFLFNEISYHIGEREVERKRNADIASIVNKLINNPYSKQNKSKFRIDTGEDYAGILSPTANVTDIGHKDYNKSFDKKHRADATKTYRYQIKLSELFALHEYWPVSYDGQEHQVKIQLKPLTSNSLILRNTAAKASKVVLDKLVLWEATVRPSEFMKQRLLEMKQTQPGEPPNELYFQWEAPNVITQTFNSKSNIQWRISEAATRVQRVVIFYRNPANISAQDKNSHICRTTNKLSSTYLIYNGNKLPQIDFDTVNGTDYSRLYNEYLKVSGYGPNSMDNCPLTYEEFVNAYPVICFDLRQLSADVLSFGSMATLDFSANFTSSVDVEFTACVYQDRAMTIVNSPDAMMAKDVSGLY